MNKTIYFYRQNEMPYGVFSNFDTHHAVNIDGVVWKTTEHYFQAMKFITTEPDYALEIKNAETPKVAAEKGRDRNHILREDWEEVKDYIMHKAVEAKFTQYDDLKKLLLSTGDSEIIEHTKNDKYWADGGDGSGQNKLGKILMQIRTSLK